MALRLNRPGGLVASIASRAQRVARPTWPSCDPLYILGAALDQLRARRWPMFRFTSNLVFNEIPQVLQRRALILVSALFVLLPNAPQLAFHGSATLRRFALLQLLGHLV